MPRFKIAHIREQGVDLIIIPLESSFGYKSKQDQNSIITEFQERASSAGLAGTVVPVWDSGGGRMALLPLKIGIRSLEVLAFPLLEEILIENCIGNNFKFSELFCIMYFMDLPTLLILPYPIL